MNSEEPLVVPARRLSLAGAMVILEAALGQAARMGVPQCVSIVDAGGNLLAFARMDGAKVLSQRSSFAKAQTAASSGVASGGIAADNELKLAMATDGGLTNLRGGLPVVVDGQVVGGIGVGSGTGAQDVEVGEAGLAALAARMEESG